MKGTTGIIKLLAAHIDRDLETPKIIVRLVFPYYELGDLKKFMSDVKTDYQKIPMGSALSIIKQILTAL